MFTTTIIPTVGRATLARAVNSVLDQDFDVDSCEVIVVNDSGRPLSYEKWQDSERCRVIDTQRRERSVARNAGAAMAAGKYLHFLDDDDWLLPGALRAFWNADRTVDSDVIWLYGSYRTVDNHGNVVAEWSPGIEGNVSVYLISGESIPFQNSLLRADAFFAVGGFNQAPGLVGVEDREVGRRLALLGDLKHVKEIVAAIRIGEESSTTKWSEVGKRDQLGREQALALPAVRARVCAAGYSSYWSGRLSRSFLGSAVWNLRRGQGLTAFSRALGGLALSGHHPFKRAYWRGLRGLAE